MRRRLVLKRGPDALRTAAEIAALGGVTVIDGAGSAGLLVDVESETFDDHQEALRGWTVAEEAEYPLPGSGGPPPVATDPEGSA